MTARAVELTGGSPWGFRMHGGSDTNQPLRISRVNPGRKAALSGIREGDVISSINNVSTKNMTNAQAHQMLKNAGDALKLGLNEDLGSPRRKGSVKANATELKRPSQLIAEVQTQSTPKPEENNGPFVFRSPKVDLCPTTSHLSTLSVSIENHSPRLPSPSKTRQISDNSSIYSSALKSPVRNPKTLTDPLKSPSLLTSPSRQRTVSQLSNSPFIPLESTSLVRSSIQPSITMPTITPPTFSYPSDSSPNLSNSNRINTIYSSVQSNDGTNNKFQPTATQHSTTNYLPLNSNNTLNTSPRYSPTYHLESSRLSPRSPSQSTVLSPSHVSPLHSQTNLNISTPNNFPHSVGQNVQNGAPQVIQNHSTPHLQNNSNVVHHIQTTYQVYPPQSEQTSTTHSPYFPFNSAPSIGNISTCSSYLSASKPVTSNTTHSPSHSGLQRQSSPFNTHTSSAPNSLPPVVTHPPSTTSKTSLSSIQLPHYLLYSTPTTTKSTNPFITKEYLMTKTEISEESVTETQEVTTTKKLSLNGYEEPSASAFDKALSSLRIGGTKSAEVPERTLSPRFDGVTSSSGLSPLGVKPPQSPQDFIPKSVWSPSGSFQNRRDDPLPSSGVQAPSAFVSKLSEANHQQTTPSLANGFVPGGSYSSSISKSVVSEIKSNIFNKTESSESSKIVNNSSEKISSNSIASDSVKQSSKEEKPSTVSTSSVPVPPPPPPLPVWTPKSQPSSPIGSKKEFKPVSFESPSLQRKAQDSEAPKSKGDLLWESRLAGSQSAPAAPGLSGLAGGPPPPPPPPAPAPLPRAQNPTITLLQKAREGQLPRGAAYLPSDKDRDPPRDRRSPPRLDSDEIVYTIRRDYSSDTDSGGLRRRMEITPRKYEGIGPTTKDGMPIVLRSEVKEANQSKWYKKMYDTIHKNKYDDDYVTVRYKSRRAHPSGLHTGPRNTSQYAYFDPKSGYLSEPEGGARGGWMSDAYDSDASACRSVGARRHSALDKGRLSDKENNRSEYLPDTTKYSTLASAKASQEIYRNQPGRIEDYVPGKSSVVDKEAKQWWDEVMDIFDGWLDENSPLPPYNILLARAIERSQLGNAPGNHQPHVINNKQSISSSALSKSYMARALKESGYESDSTLVFRRREGSESLLSPREQRQAYRELQAGGEPPLQGFRKPAPDRPKDDTEIEYFPLSPTLTRIRIHKNVSKNLSNNIVCYPIHTTLTAPRSLLEEKQSVPSFISFEYPKVNRVTPPAPPKRHSSKANSTLRLVSSISTGRAIQREKSLTSSNVKYLQNRLNNKIAQRYVSRESRRKEVLETKMKSADGKRIKTTKTTVPTVNVSQTGKVKSSKISNGKKRTSDTTKGTSSFSSPRRTMSPIEYASPTMNRYFSDSSNKVVIEGGVGRKTPITGILDRGTSLDRTFASEKKILPLKSIRESPVKTLSKSTETLSSGGSSKLSSDRFKIQKLPPGTTVKHSTVLLPSRDKGNKTLHISVAMSPRGRDFLRTSDRFLAMEKRKSPTPSEISSHTYNADSPSRSLNDITKRSSSKSNGKKLSEVKSKIKTSNTSLNKIKSSKTSLKHKSSDDLSVTRKSSRDESSKLRNSKANGKKSVKNSKSEEDKSKRFVNLNQILDNKSDKSGALDPKSLPYIKLLNKHIDSYVDQYENNPTISYNEILDRRDAVMTDSFFQHLFLRDVPNRFHFPNDTNYYSTTVLEKAKLFQNTSSNTNHLSRYSNSYLSNRKPVSESKFRSWDRNELVRISPRALSWPGRQIARIDTSKSLYTSRYPSKIENRSKSEPPVQKLIFSQTVRPKSPVLPKFTRAVDSPKKLVYKRVPSPPAKIIFSQTSRPLSPIIVHHKRKKTPEPERNVSPSKIIFSQTSRPVCQNIIKRNIELVSQKGRSRSESPVSTSNKYGKNAVAVSTNKRKSSLSPSKEYTSPRIVSKIRVQSPSPSPLRSPSCRRIHSARISQCRAAECVQSLKSKVLRTQSAGDADSQRSRDIRYDRSSLDRSTSTAELEHIRNHLDYQEYITELKHRRAKSERFKELNKFYAYLERIGQLERATSSSDLRPRKRYEEIIDFERWKRIRAQERAEDELNRLYKRMKLEQQEKDLLFLPHDAETFKWSGDKDWNLRAKEKSVEDLKDHFNRMAESEDRYDYKKHRDLILQRDSYKPLWRGNSVINLASSLSSRRQSDSSFKAERVPSRVRTEPTVANIRERLGIGSRLWSSLSMEQVSALKSQLNSIYSKEFETKQKDIEKDTHEDYVITIPPLADKPSNALQVRCNSFTVGDQVNEMDSIRPHKSDSISSINHVPHEKDIKNSINALQNLTEKDKKRISMTLSQAVLEKIKQSKEIYSPVVLGKETRGAIASAKIRGISKSGSESPGSSITKDENVPPNSQDRTSLIDSWSIVEAEENPKNHSPLRPSSASENETGSSDTSNKTVIFRGTCEDIKKKIDFFEKAPLEDSVCSIIYRPREDSPEEKDDTQEEKQEKQVKIPSPPPCKMEEIRISPKRITHSTSYTSLKDIFGETQKNNFSSLTVNIKPSEMTQRSDSKDDSGNPSLVSNFSSTENICRSRSLSPDPERYWRAYLSLVKAGDVGKLKKKFELIDFINDSELSIPTLRRHQSDPEIVRTFLQHNWKKLNKSANVKRHERGDVDRLTHKYELSSTRGRSRSKKATSPIPKTPLRPDNRDMPHIDIISKLASLKPRSLTAPPIPTKEYPDECPVGEVERIRKAFEKRDTSLLGQMFTSAPDFNELRDIAPYLSGSWTAHKYPRRQDNNRSLSSSDYISEDKYSPVRKDRPRPKSVSPMRSKIHKSSGSILKGSKAHDVFANQEFDPSKHRPRFRYEPPREEAPVPPRPVRPSWPKVLPTFTARPTVTFQDPDLAPIPPPKGYNGTRDYLSESPRRYVESDVNIHYRVPVRQEPRPLVPEDELARRQADHMRRVYQEERRRKYLQELQDMNSRRHTDNFTPSQKSPISLNRYDNFGSTGSLSRGPQLARALHNFTGQGARELTFRRGDLILVRRRIDTNWYEGEIDGQVGLFPYNYVEMLEYDTTSIQPRITEGRARAKFNFVAQTHLELGLKKGELVVLTRRVDENWYEGRLGGRKGIFPVTYVEVLAEPQINRAELPPTIATGKPMASPAAHSIVGAAGAASLGAHHYTPQINNPNLSNSPSSSVPLTLPSQGLTSHHARPASATLPRASDPSAVNLNNHEPLFVDTNAEAVPYRAMYKYRPQNPDELELQEGDTVYVLEKCDDGWYVGSSQRTGRFGTFPGNYVEKI